MYNITESRSSGVSQSAQTNKYDDPLALGIFILEQTKRGLLSPSVITLQKLYKNKNCTRSHKLSPLYLRSRIMYFMYIQCTWTDMCTCVMVIEKGGHLMEYEY